MHDFVVIPALNPDTNLISIVNQLSDDSNLEIVIVNDGSNEQYQDVFQAVLPSAMILTHAKNQGKGTAIKTALNYINKFGSPGSVIVTADADGQHITDDIFHILREAHQQRDGIVLGVRNFSGDIPLRSRLGNGITSAVFHFLTGIRLQDTQTGLRAFDIQLVPFLLGISGERYEYETNVLLSAAKKKIKLIQVPIQTVYLSGNHSSHFQVIRDSLHIYWNILKFAFSSLICCGIDYGIFVLASLFLNLLPVNPVRIIIISNIAARFISSICNFHFNYRYVFCYNGDMRIAALQYFTLAAGILCINTSLIICLVSILGLSSPLAKILTECLLFFVSFLLQRFLIFNRTSRIPLADDFIHR